MSEPSIYPVRPLNLEGARAVARAGLAISMTDRQEAVLERAFFTAEQELPAGRWVTASQLHSALRRTMVGDQDLATREAARALVPVFWEQVESRFQLAAAATVPAKGRGFHPDHGGLA